MSSRSTLKTLHEACNNLELKRILEVKDQSQVQVNPESVLVYSETELQEFNFSGKLLKTSSTTSSIRHISEGPLRTILTTTQLEFSDGTCFSLPPDLYVQKTFWLNETLLLQSESLLYLFRSSEIFATIPVNCKFLNVSNTLILFIALSDHQIFTINDYGEYQVFPHPFCEPGLFSLKNDLLAATQGETLNFFSIRLMMRIKSVKLQDTIECIKFLDPDVNGANLAVVIKKQLLLYFFSFSKLELVFKTSFNSCKLLDYGLVMIDRYVCKVQEVEDIVNVKLLIRSGKHNEAAELAEKLERSENNFIKNTLDSFLNDTDFHHKFGYACDFVDKLKNESGENVEFIIQKCLSQKNITFESISNSLDRLVIFCSKTKKIINKNALISLKNTHKKLKIYNEACASRINFEEWESFRRSSCIEQIKQLFDSRMIKQGISLFNCCKNQINVNDIIMIITHLPVDIDINLYYSWVKNEVICLLDSENLLKMELFIIERAKAIEATNTDPKKALKFMKILSKSPAVQQKSKFFIPLNQNLVLFQLSHTFLTLESSLHSIINLLQNYSIRIKLESIQNESKFSIAFKILKDLSFHNFDNIINSSLSRYCQETSLNKDSIIFKYLKLKFKSNYRIIDPDWEKVLFSLVKIIKDSEIRSKIIFRVLTDSNSITVKMYQDLLDYSLSYDSSLKSHFLSLKSVNQFKFINQKYTTEILSTTNSYSVIKFIYFILNSKISTCIEDAFQAGLVLKGFTQVDAVLIFIESCIEQKDVARVSTLKGIWQKIDSPKAVSDMLIEYCLKVLDEKKEKKYSKEKYIIACDIIILLLTEFIRKSSEHSKNFRIIKRLLDLSKKFSILISYSDYFCKKKTFKTLTQSIQVFIDYSLELEKTHSTEIVSIKKTENNITTLSSLENISALLLIDYNDLYISLAKHSSFHTCLDFHTLGYLKKASKCSLTTKKIKNVVEISVQILQKKFDNSVPNKLKKIIENALLKCSNTDIEFITSLITPLDICEGLTASIHTGKADEDFPETITEEICISTKECRSTLASYFKSIVSSEQIDTLSLLESILSKGGHRTSFHLLQTIPVPKDPYLTTVILTQLFTSLKQSRHIHCTQFLTIMFEMHEPEKFSSLSTTILEECIDITTQLIMCETGKIYSALLGQTETLANWLKAERFTRWKKKMAKIGVSPNILQKNCDESEVVKMIFRKGGKIQFCLEIAEFLGWNKEEVIKNYLKTIIIKPIVKENVINELKSGVFSYTTYPFDTFFIGETEKWVSQLENLTALQLFTDCLTKIVQVDFTRMHFVLMMGGRYKEIFKIYAEIVSFLKEHTRRSDPTPEEQNQLQDNPNLCKEAKELYKEINKKHLGLGIFLQSSEEILYQEICVNNCNDLIKLHLKVRSIKKDLDKTDELYCRAVLNEINWRLELKQEVPLFSDLKLALVQIKSCSKVLELLDKVAGYYSQNDDIVKIREYQVKVAIESSSKTSQSAEIYTHKYTTDKIKLLLNKAGLFQYFYNCIEEKVELIKGIYNLVLPKILTNLEFFCEKEVTVIINTIIETYDLDSEKIHLDLIIEWLGLNDDLSTSTTNNWSKPSYSFSKYSDETSLLIAKVLHIFSQYPGLPVANMLSDIVISNFKYSGLVKARALSIIFHLKGQIPEKLRTVDCGFKDLVNRFYYLADFELLKIPVSLKELVKTEQIEKVCRKVLSKYQREKRTLQLIACMLIENYIFDFSLYISTITSLQQLQDHESIIYVIDRMINAGVIESLAVDEHNEEIQNLVVKLSKTLNSKKNVKAFGRCCRKLMIQDENLIKISKSLIDSNSQVSIEEGFLLAKFGGIKTWASILAILFQEDFEKLQKYLSKFSTGFELTSQEKFFASVKDNPIFFNVFESNLTHSTIVMYKSLLNNAKN